MKITTIGIDLAKNVFQLHGINAQGKTLLKKQLRRDAMLMFFVNHPPCRVGMEACGGAHYWARKLRSFGHDVKLMAPQFVKPYVKTNKHDEADAEAICEAVTRPNMRFVPVKTEEQQSILSVHRAREEFVKSRTAQANALRGLLSELGIVIPPGLSQIAVHLPEILENANNGLPVTFRQLLQRLSVHLKELERQVMELEKEIQRWHRENADSKRLSEIPGIGPITASALVASIGDARQFSNGRQLTAWLGLVPRQHSSGGKSTLLDISKRGDTYLRALLVYGARAVVRYVKDKTGRTEKWLNNLLSRRNTNVAVVAMANENARIIWALLAHGRSFEVNYNS